MAHSSPHHQYMTNGHNMVSNKATTLPRDGTLSPTSDIESKLDELDRSRSRKKRDFFGTLKKRLSRSKTRTKSMDREMVPIDPNNPAAGMRSISADRSHQNNNNSNTAGRNLNYFMICSSNPSNL